MTLHLVKLCVGVETVDELRRYVEQCPGEQAHPTRMTPKRGDELLDEGSLYWVIKGMIQCRQRLLDLRPHIGEDGVSRCCLVLEKQIIPVGLRPMRPFQGWRYLEASKAPADRSIDAPAPTETIARELRKLGLI